MNAIYDAEDYDEEGEEIMGYSGRRRSGAVIRERQRRRRERDPGASTFRRNGNRRFPFVYLFIHTRSNRTVIFSSLYIPFAFHKRRCRDLLLHSFDSAFAVYE